jgi:hypothetical protein
MSFENLSWVLVAISLLGNIFVIKRNVIGQWLWTVGNTGWILYDLSMGAYSQAFLFAAYLAMSIWGVIEWTRQDAKQKASNQS